MLTDAKVRRIRSGEKPQKLADSGGLFLFVTPSGSRIWRYRYRFGGVEKQIVLGHYPDMPLAKARLARDEAKAILKSGRDPIVDKRQVQAAGLEARANTFECVAREWHRLQAPTWTATHTSDVLRNLERDVFPEIGRAPIADLNARRILEVVRNIETRGAVETAHRTRQRISAVFGYAIALGICENDPADQIRRLLSPIKRRQQPALTLLDDLREVLKAVETTPAHPVTKLAHRLLALTALRPGVVIETPWEEFADLDPEAPVWVVPSSRMKLRQQFKGDERRDHFVLLAPQSIEVIEAVRMFSGRSPVVFPNSRFAHRTMSENAISYLLNRAGYHHRHVPHGWRAAFSTVMNERHPTERHIIDFALGHVPKDRVEAAYNRARYLDRRREMALEWAQLILEGQRPLAEIIALPRRTYK